MSASDEPTRIYVDLPHHRAMGGESMWARPLGEDLYELLNVPFYAYDLNYLDVVRATPDAIPEIREGVPGAQSRKLRLRAGGRGMR